MGFLAARRTRAVPVIVTGLTATLVALGGPPADAVSPGAASPPTAAAAPAPQAVTSGMHRSCSRPRPGAVGCLSVWRHARSRLVVASGPARVGRATVTRPTEGYRPADIAAAYHLNTSTGIGQTIAVVDAYDNPRAEADLAVYRKAWRLPPCTSANGCFRKLNQRGGSTPPPSDVGWGIEIALDIQAVSATCPKCNILLIEADDNSFGSIGQAVNTAVRLGARVVSNSYGADEFPGVLSLATAYYTHPGVAQVAASGDAGFGPAQMPATFPSVIAAGGTSLSRKANGTWSERAWEGSGSGCSEVVAKPAWQQDTGCSMRTVADLAALADPDTGFAIYDTYGLDPYGGWLVVGGTSVAAPLVAGMIGLAGNSYRLDSARYIYRHGHGLRDVTKGSNGTCDGSYLCQARRGYDGPTGLGSPQGVGAL